MFPFWEKVVAPILEASEVKRLVEIGALRGENTRQILDTVGPEAELHVIDPVPDFDPEEHAKQFGGQYIFHRDLSVNVLGDLPVMDAALIDGDHNWYTVYHECRLLAEVSTAAGAPLPVMVFHDVCWPYGRRDLYYNPDNVPTEYRHEWQYKGMRPGVARLVPQNGLNPTMANAVLEGGPRNGVMTGVDDFVAEYPKPLRVLVLPIYFGLAIVVEQERLARQPRLAAFLDWLESLEGKDMIIELAEGMRLDAMLFQHRIFFQKEEELGTLAGRYLDSVKRGLANELYLENELRIAHLADVVEKQRPPELPRLRDPQRFDLDALTALREQRRTGAEPPAGSELATTDYAYAPAGRLLLDAVHQGLDAVRTGHVRGHLVSTGVGRGGVAMLMRAYLDAYKQKDREVWVVDRFRSAAPGRNAPDVADGLASMRADLNLVRDGFHALGLLDERTHFLQGDPAATLPDAPVDRVAVLHVGAGTGADVTAVLEQLYPRLAPDGVVLVERATDPEVRAALDAFRAAHAVTDLETAFGASGTSWRRGTGFTATAPSVAAAAGAARAPLAVPVPSGSCDLSVVLVVHDMRREAARTLYSLSRRYQQGVEGLEYEVIVVENGSSPEGNLGEAFVRGFGPEFRYLDLGPAATPSPAPALNRGVAASVGTVVALMVDGAHVVTPGLIREAMTGITAYEPAVVAVQPWHVGPGQQGDTMRSGYDQAAEDELFEGIAWPTDGYRLFEISHFQGDRDWLDGLWESNCLFVPRKVLEQSGGFDEGFAEAGGGFTNLDVYERLGATPGVTLVTVLGEGSFHQVHGGTTTNQADPSERRDRVFSFGERYAELRGRPYSGPEKQIRYVGSFHGDAARRTRARRLSAAAFGVNAAVEGPDGPARTPVPIPDDLRDDFVAAYWRSLAWRQTRWMGRTAFNAPTDLHTYQELVAEVRPDWVIETGTREGGRALFFAHLFDLLGHGRVVSIDNRDTPDLPEHPRLTYVHGRAHDDDVVAEVRRIVGTDGPDANALVVLGTRGAQRRMHREFEIYADFVSVGSYVVMEHTVLNGYPVEASNGPGPFEANRRILNLRGDFASDTTRERHGLTFNPGGFLKRVK
jgi:cephalosporin hydroxylase